MKAAATFIPATAALIHGKSLVAASAMPFLTVSLLHARKSQSTGSTVRTTNNKASVIIAVAALALLFFASNASAAPVEIKNVLPENANGVQTLATWIKFGVLAVSSAIALFSVGGINPYRGKVAPITPIVPVANANLNLNKDPDNKDGKKAGKPEEEAEEKQGAKEPGKGTIIDKLASIAFVAVLLSTSNAYAAPAEPHIVRESYDFMWSNILPVIGLLFGGIVVIGSVVFVAARAMGKDKKKAFRIAWITGAIYALINGGVSYCHDQFGYGLKVGIYNPQNITVTEYGRGEYVCPANYCIIGDTSVRPAAWLVIDGKEYGTFNAEGVTKAGGLFIKTKDGRFYIVRLLRSKYGAKEVNDLDKTLQWLKIRPQDISTAFQAGPVTIENGNITISKWSDDKAKAIVGIDAKGRFVAVTTGDWTLGAIGPDAVSLVKQLKDQYQLKWAMLVDSGSVGNWRKPISAIQYQKPASVLRQSGALKVLPFAIPFIGLGILTSSAKAVIPGAVVAVKTATVATKAATFLGLTAGAWYIIAGICVVVVVAALIIKLSRTKSAQCKS